MLLMTMRLEFRESLIPMSKVKSCILKECFTPGLNLLNSANFDEIDTSLH